MRAIFASGLMGIRQGERLMEAASANLSRLSVSGATAVQANGEAIVQTGAPVDPVQSLVALEQGRLMVAANSAVLKQANKTSKRLLDLYA